MITLPTQAIIILHHQLLSIYASVPREKRQPISKKEIERIIMDWIEDHHPGLSPKNIIKKLENEDLIRKGPNPSTWIPQWKIKE
jgi:hypothetical protein